MDEGIEQKGQVGGTEMGRYSNEREGEATQPGRDGRRRVDPQLTGTRAGW